MPKELSEMGPDRMLSRGEIRKSRTSFLVHRTNTMNFFFWHVSFEGREKRFRDRKQKKEHACIKRERGSLHTA